VTRALSNCGVVVYRFGGGIDAIDQYSRRLVEALRAGGSETQYFSNGLSPLLASSPEPPWVLLQYNAFRYGKWGFAPGLVRDALRLRRRHGTRLSIMVHEAWVPMTDWRSTVMGRWQRVQLRTLVRLADGVMTSTEALAREIGHGAVHVPIATNVTPSSVSRAAARDRLGIGRKLAVALLGRAHPSRALDYAESAIAAVVQALGAERLVVMNLGADAPDLAVSRAVEVRSPGRQTEDELSVGLSASDLILLPFTDGVSTRRTTLMAALAHGLPVVGLNGHNTDSVLKRATDAMVLCRCGDRPGFARATVELTRDPAHMRAVGEAGRRLYQARFDWPVLARSVASQLNTTAAGRYGSAASTTAQ
jgi:glycosyltransferase involved in cell wall biosynthesis